MTQEFRKFESNTPWETFPKYRIAEGEEQATTVEKTVEEKK